jgi:hypothetical protein
MMNHKPHLHAFELSTDDDETLPLAPDEDLDPGDTRSDDDAPAAVVEATPAPSEDSSGETMEDALRWALESMSQPSMTAADWLARDIDPSQPTVVGLLTNPKLTLTQVRQAKTVFKTMRIVGETSADRRIGARMYAAAIAAALARFRVRISTQSDVALKRGFQGLLDDRSMPMPLRDIAGTALVVLAELQKMDGESQRRNRSA